MTTLLLASSLPPRSNSYLNKHPEYLSESSTSLCLGNWLMLIKIANHCPSGESQTCSASTILCWHLASVSQCTGYSEAKYLLSCKSLDIISYLVSWSCGSCTCVLWSFRPLPSLFYHGLAFHRDLRAHIGEDVKLSRISLCLTFSTCSPSSKWSFVSCL